MSRAITITYDLRPPAGTPSPGACLSSTKSHEIGAEVVKDDGGEKGYYQALREAIGTAKGVLGEELTVWRDAVGNREQGKEARVPMRGEDEEGEEEGTT
ncbi:hypothetical protein JAAARDRAFT_360460 [Jaapia argillacea MUCL 33604]|uniref:Uncharacterized protein n=1 Tax=Jaapia argillacea MUCL 33604 TaxID=933084 RepID=A0A067QHH9_9AGAM|nr:hypothetical protein JAAARDRAFT_360460 [Jaapia argillacea MUCL 33604]